MLDSPRTLFLVQQQPYPLNGGVSLRNWQNLNLMRRWGPVGIFSIYRGQPDLKSLSGFEFWHHYNLSSSQRPWWEKVQRRLWWRRAETSRADGVYTHQAAQQLKQVLATYQPDLIIVEQIWFYRYLPILKKYGCPIIFDNHNVEGDDSRYQGVTHMRRKLDRIRYMEQKVIQQATQTWMCSDTDIKMLNSLYTLSRNNIKVIPNGINPDDYADIRSGSAKVPSNLENNPHILLYIGRFSYQPNAEAAELLIHEIFPVLKTYADDCKLLLVGYDPTPKMLSAAATNSHIIVTGQVDDVKPYIAAASMMIVPLQKGSGTRLKLLEAFAAGCPAISTAKGAEGLQVMDGQHILIRETPQEMVNAVKQLWKHPHQAKVMADQAYQQFLENYAWPSVQKQITTALEALPR